MIKTTWHSLTCDKSLFNTSWKMLLSLPKAHLIPFFKNCLTLSQTTNFRLFQTKRACRRQFQVWGKWQKVLLNGRKQCGKRRNCLLQAISPFPSVFKRLVLQTHKNQGLFGKRLIKFCLSSQLMTDSIIMFHILPLWTWLKFCLMIKIW